MQYLELIKQVLENSSYRKVVLTARPFQVTLRSLRPGEQTGREAHGTDRFSIFISGTGTAISGGEEKPIAPGIAICIGKGSPFNFINTGSDDLKYVSVISPPEYKDGTVHGTKEDDIMDPYKERV